MAWVAAFHTTWAEIGYTLMAVSGAGMARDLYRRHTTARRRPACRPYDWARDVPQLRQAVTVRRRQAS